MERGGFEWWGFMLWIILLRSSNPLITENLSSLDPRHMYRKPIEIGSSKSARLNYSLGCIV